VVDNSTEPAQLPPFHSQMLQLRELGFTDDTRNAELLFRLRGNVDLVIEKLLAETDQEEDDDTQVADVDTSRMSAKEIAELEEKHLQKALRLSVIEGGSSSM